MSSFILFLSNLIKQNKQSFDAPRGKHNGVFLAVLYKKNKKNQKRFDKF